MNDNLLTNSEIIIYTSAVLYSDISNPLNTSCPITNIPFRSSDYVCRLPCGHLFDGPSICYNLTRISSHCPVCNNDVRNGTPRAAPPPPLPNENSSTTRLPTSPIQETSSNINTRTQNILRDVFTQLFDENYIRDTTNTTNTTNTINSTTNGNSRYHLDEILYFIQELPQFSNTNTTTSASIPTNSEIQEATELIAYETIDNPPDDCCPISYEEFEGESIVCRIKHCGHIFKPEHLNKWFETSSKCPVCRYNIKPQVQQVNQNQNNRQNTRRNNSSGYTFYSTTYRL
jgi:hypothetical protein